MEWNKKGVRISAFLCLAIALALYVYADPTGTSIVSNSTSNGPTVTPGNRSDAGGTITTMVLNAVQQNTQWKAYVGNITGTLTLDDSAGNTIFDWSLAAASITGEVYSSRASSVTWGLINCTNVTVIGSEETTLGITPTATDSIRNTFNETTHSAIVSAGRTIGANTCNSTSTYVNDSRQAIGSSYFPLILLDDDTSIVYTTFIRQDTVGFNNLTTYDFQMIVADTPTTTNTTYYFYAEIG